MGRKKKLVTYDKEAQVAKTKEIHGEDAFKKWGSKGGKNNKTNTSEKGRMAANARWAKHRAEQAKGKEE